MHLVGTSHVSLRTAQDGVHVNSSTSHQESVAEQWAKILKDGGYELPVAMGCASTKVIRYSRTWRRLHRLLRVRPDFTFFEVGCGGGWQLVPLAFHGHTVAGIDYSVEVLDRCRRYISYVEREAERKLPITLYAGDFLEFLHDRTYDVVFNFGVIEHFLDERERLSFLKKMAAFAKRGGHVVSVVPNGMHPLRARQRTENLGGYLVPEIDYTDKLALSEMIGAGLQSVRVIPANLFGYLHMEKSGSALARCIKQITYLAVQLIPGRPTSWALRHAGSLLIIGQRPE